jgi:hypothetical protein
MLKITRKNLIKSLLSSLTIVALVIGGFFMYNPKETRADLWNDGWAYRQPITVTNNTTAQTNFYISLNLNTDTASTSMQTDCGDFRFVTEAGEILDYYIQSGCRGTTTVVHVAYEFNRGKPIAYWSFDECQGSTIYDSAKSWNGATSSNGTLIVGTGGAITATGTCAVSASSFWYNGSSGKVNSAGSFDGTDDYINYGDVLDMGTTDMSISGKTLCGLGICLKTSAF